MQLPIAEEGFFFSGEGGLYQKMQMYSKGPSLGLK